MNQDQEEREEWMYKPFYVIDGYLFFKRDFLDGVDTFIDFATCQPRFMNGEDIKCPCSRCINEHFKNPDEVLRHILKYGFVKNYYFWLFHGETRLSKTKEKTLVSDHESNACHNNSDSDEVQENLHKAKKKRKAEKKGLTNKWDDDEVQKKSRKAKKNRLTEPEKPGTSIAKHTEESKCAQQHTIASAKGKEVPTDPVTWEAFLRLNYFKGPVPDPKSAGIAAEVTARFEEMSRPLPGTSEERDVDMTALYLDVLNSQACSSIASTSTVNSGGSSQLETKSIKRVKAKWQSKAQLNCFGVGSLQCPSKPRSYEEMQTLLRAQEEEMQRRFLEQEEWLLDKEERLQEKEEELRDKELQLMEREKNAIRWAKKWDLLFPLPLPPITSTDGNG